MSNEMTKIDLEVLLMKETYGMSYSAIAKELGVSKTRVRQLYERAKNKEHVSNLPDDPNKISFKEFAEKHLDPAICKALFDANIKSYYDFIKLDDISMIMIKGIGPSRVIELIKFKELLISHIKKN